MCSIEEIKLISDRSYRSVFLRPSLSFLFIYKDFFYYSSEIFGLIYNSKTPQGKSS